MSLLTQVQAQYDAFMAPKAISHHPELVGRVHLYSSATATGAAEIIEDYANYATVYSTYIWVKKALTIIVDNLVSLPVVVMDADDETQENHYLTQLLAHVNDIHTPMDLWSAYLVHKMLGGEEFIQIVPDKKGRPAELWSRRPDKMIIYPDASQPDYYMPLRYEFDGEGAEPLMFDPKAIIHDKFYNPLSPWRGLAPIRAVKEGIIIDLFAQSWSKKFFRNSARPDFALVAPQGLTEGERDRYLEDFLGRNQGVNKAHLPVVLEQGIVDVKPFSWAPKDIEWLQQRQFARDEVAAIWNVPDEIMGFGKDTYENFDKAHEVLWTLCLVPIINRRDVTLTSHFHRYGWLEKQYRIRTDLNSVGILQEDKQPKVTMAKEIWAMGVPFNTVDERLSLGFGAIPGGDIGYIPTSVQPIEMAAVQLERARNPQPVPPQLQPSQNGNGQPPEEQTDQEQNEEEEEEEEDQETERQAEVRRLRNWLRKRIKDGRKVDLSVFNTHLLSSYEKRAILLEMEDGLIPAPMATKQTGNPDDYEDEITALVEQAQAGELEQDTFERRMRELAAAAILLAFLRGARKRENELTDAERALVRENVRIAQESVLNLAADLYDGRYTPDEGETEVDVPSIDLRIGLWGAALSAVVNLGMMHRQDDPILRWRRDPAKDSCVDCLDLDEQEHTASEWREIGFYPQSPDLECHGLYCGCFWEEV